MSHKPFRLFYCLGVAACAAMLTACQSAPASAQSAAALASSPAVSSSVCSTDATAGATQRPEENASYIGAEKATAIALESASISKDAVKDLETELESKNGAVYYEVEFEADHNEYEYSIDAVTGEVLRFEEKHD